MRSARRLGTPKTRLWTDRWVPDDVEESNDVWSPGEVHEDLDLPLIFFFLTGLSTLTTHFWLFGR